MQDQANELVTSTFRPESRRLLRTAWAGALAAVTAGGLLFVAAPSTPAAHVPGDDRDQPALRQGLTVRPARQPGLPGLAASDALVEVMPPDQGQKPSSRETAGARGARAHTDPTLRRSLLDAVTAFGSSTFGRANGLIPAAVLCPLEFAPGHLLRCDAAGRLAALNAEFEREFGHPIPITDSYRSFVQQVAVARTKPHLAAIPGTSNHGWGLAVDLGGSISGGASPEYVWLRVHGPDYGWDNPSWARPDGTKPEPWHFEFFAAGAVPDRAIDPSDVGTWISSSPPDAGRPASAAPMVDPGRKDRSAAGKVHRPGAEPVDRPRKKPREQEPAKPTPKPTPSKPAPSPSPSTSPSTSPSPSEPSEKPSASPSPTPPELPSAPAPSPTPSGPVPSPTPSSPEPEVSPTTVPTPDTVVGPPATPAPSSGTSAAPDAEQEGSNASAAPGTGSPRG